MSLNWETGKQLDDEELEARYQRWRVELESGWNEPKPTKSRWLAFVLYLLSGLAGYGFYRAVVWFFEHVL
jgi:hypothetical protein